MKNKTSRLAACAVLAAFVFIFCYRDISRNFYQIGDIFPRRNLAVLSGQPGRYSKVARVIDGDTVELANGDRLRYIGIDTPEEVNPRKPIQCFSKEAAARNRALVEGKTVVFYKDVSDRDKYGRLLGFVYLEDGTFVNLALVQEGFAFSYPYRPDISRAAEFQRAEAEARKAGRGLWSACEASQIH